LTTWSFDGSVPNVCDRRPTTSGVLCVTVKIVRCPDVHDATVACGSMAWWCTIAVV